MLLIRDLRMAAPVDNCFDRLIYNIGSSTSRTKIFSDTGNLDVDI
jgi:hypothetical protein